MLIPINTPALLFPAITLLMLAYTNRFLALATLIRKLNSEYKASPANKHLLKAQIKNIRRRLTLIKQMQAAGILSFFFCVLCMLFIYIEVNMLANITFGLSLIVLLISLERSLQEIYISTRALEIELKDMED
jgi:Protein of unknown function (DUF2721)